MSIYTTVDEAYEVCVYHSFRSLWFDVSRHHPDAYLDQSHLVDGPTNKLTSASLRRELKGFGIAWIYEGDKDWSIKIQRQS